MHKFFAREEIVESPNTPQLVSLQTIDSILEAQCSYIVVNNGCTVLKVTGESIYKLLNPTMIPHSLIGRLSLGLLPFLSAGGAPLNICTGYRAG